MVRSDKQSNLRLTLEWLALFIVLPVVIYYFRMQIAFRVVLLVILAAAGLSVYLVLDHSFPTINFWRTENLTRHLRRIGLTFFVPSIAVALWTAFAAEHLFLSFPKEKPTIWLIVLLLYPVLAAYPQEIIYRGFFFHRYATLFPNPRILILVNSVCFGWAHLIYGNWVAPVLSALGGFLFAYRYWDSQSLLVVGIEHGLWGNFLFTVGIGWYFYSGSIG